MTLNFFDIALYFITGGTSVALAVGLARLGYPVLSAMAVLFPAATLISLIFIGAQVSDAAVVTNAKQFLVINFVAWVPYVASVVLLTPRLGYVPAMAVGVTIFTTLALAWFYINQTLKLI